MPTLDIVIVNWNTGAKLRECLDSIASAQTHEYTLSRVVVVDNASVDGSADHLGYLQLPLSIIHNLENRGFAVACNQGATGSTADYLLFLNPDTRLLTDTLIKSVHFMATPEAVHVGILGVQLLADSGEIARTCARFPTTRFFIAQMLGLTRLFPRTFLDHFYSEWDHRQSRQIEQIMGAYFFVRKRLFADLGGFDERFFVYFEEVDFSFRARQRGWSTYFLCTAQCHHSGGVSSGQVFARRLFYSLRSRLLYGAKHFGLPSAIILGLATILIEPLTRAVYAARSPRGSAKLRETVHGFALLWLALPGILFQCKAIATERRRALRRDMNKVMA